MGFYTGPFNATEQIGNVVRTAQTGSPSGVPASPAAAPTATPKATATASAPRVDPYAKWGGLAGLNEAKNNIFNNFNVGADKTAYEYGMSVQDTIRALRDNQTAINMKGAQNELGRLQGRQGVLGMVSRGVNSVGTMLGNRNAGDSSAAQTLAGVYGSMGNQEMNKVNNQAELTNQDIALMQASQDEDMATKPARLQQGKDIAVNDLVNKARASLAAINSEMASASVPDRILLEQESARIKNELLGRLQQFDSMLASAPSNIRADSQEARMTKAQGMAQAGVSAENPFQFDQVDTQMQSGPFSGNLPLFTLPRNKQRG